MDGGVGWMDESTKWRGGREGEGRVGWKIEDRRKELKEESINGWMDVKNSS